MGLGELLDAAVSALEARLHARKPPAVDQPLTAGTPGRLKPKKGPLGTSKKGLGAVLDHGIAEAVGYSQQRALGIALALHHDRGQGADEHHLLDAAGPVPVEEPGGLAAARRVANHNGVLQIQKLEELVEDVGVAVHVVALLQPRTPAVSAVVVGNDAVALAGEEELLAVPAITVERPSMRKDDQRAVLVVPVLVVNFGSSLRVKLGILVVVASRKGLMGLKMQDGCDSLWFVGGWIFADDDGRVMKLLLLVAKRSLHAGWCVPVSEPHMLPVVAPFPPVPNGADLH